MIDRTWPSQIAVTARSVVAITVTKKNHTSSYIKPGSHAGADGSSNLGKPAKAAVKHVELLAQLNLKIAVSKYNQFAPKFAQASYRKSISSTLPKGSHVMRVEAQDADSEPYNRELQYSIRTNPPGLRVPFTINSRTGDLILKSPLPFGVHQAYQFDVAACDTGSPQRQTFTSITIIITTLTRPTLTKLETTDVTRARVCWTYPYYTGNPIVSLNQETGNRTQAEKEEDRKSVSSTATPETNRPLGFVVEYQGLNYDTRSTKINKTIDESKRRKGTTTPTTSPDRKSASSAEEECVILYDLRPEINYNVQVYAWNRYEVGPKTLPKTLRTPMPCKHTYVY